MVAKTQRSTIWLDPTKQRRNKGVLGGLSSLSKTKTPTVRARGKGKPTLSSKSYLILSHSL